MKSKNTRIGMRVLLSLVAALVLFSGCSSVVFDKKAVGKVKKVAVLVYTVPKSIQYYDDPKQRKRSLLQIAASMANINNGQNAATLSQKSFIEELNRQKLGFKAISRTEMMNNAAYLKISNKWVATRSKQKGTTSGLAKAARIFGALSGSKSSEGVGPKGMPEFGLAGNWSAKSALTGGSGELAYLKDAIAALGVDAAIVINDQGYSFGCEACIGGTGSGSTHTAFLISIVDRNGEEILGMREWFNFQPRSAAMVAYIINPLQHDSLFEGHGIKTAKVFANLFRKESK
ncbi:MAG: hypothetical protein V3S64_13085 [bacterium]